MEESFNGDEKQIVFEEDEGIFLSRELLVKLPKAELHCHLDGSVRLQTILDLAFEQKIALPTGDSLAELQKVVCVSKDCPSLEVYLKAFDVTLLVLQEAYALTRVMFEVCQDASLDGVRYLEVRFSPILHVQHGLSLAAVMEAVCEGIAYANQNLSISVGIIVCGMRQMDPAVTTRLAEFCWRYRSLGVVGFDLAGPEDGFSSIAHAEAYRIVRNKMLNCTLHSGEAAGVQSILDSISTGAHRLGHGVRLRDDPSVIRLVADRGIAVEVCLSSNVQTKAVATLAEHPIRQFFEAGVAVVPCCDNWTVSSVTLSSEYDIIQRVHRFSPAEVLRLLDNGFRSAFLDPTRRHVLRLGAFIRALQVLRQAGFNPRELARHPQFFELVGADVSHSSLANLFGELIPTDLTLQSNPPVSPTLLRALPKADLHCRLSGSVTPEQIWAELQLPAAQGLLAELGLSAGSLDELRGLFATAEASPLLCQRVKLLFDRLIRSPEQLRRAYRDVLEAAARDGVMYLELTVRPYAHCEGWGDDPGAFVEDLLATRRDLLGDPELPHVSVILVVNPEKDCPVDWYAVAQLCVAHASHGVCGFGVYSDPELQPDQYAFFRKALSLLKRHNINVSMFAGSVDIPPVIAALHTAGATRISGAFSAHTYPRLLDYLATHYIPVELSVSSFGVERLKGLSTFAGSPFRYFFDARVPIVLCSFRNSLSPRNRIEVLDDVIQGGDFDVHAIITVLSNGIRLNFLPLLERQALFDRWRSKTLDVLRAHGFLCFSRKIWYVTNQNQSCFLNLPLIFLTFLSPKATTSPIHPSNEHLETSSRSDS